MIQRYLLNSTRLLARQKPTAIASVASSFRRYLNIQTAQTPNKDALKFIPGVTILPEEYNTIEFTNSSQTANSPLAAHLFAIEGVKSLMLGKTFITVEKDASYDWSSIKPTVYTTVDKYLSSGESVLASNHNLEVSTVNEDDDEIVAMIKELIDTRIRPAIQDDGGDIEFRGFEPDGTVLMKLQGACRSCDSSEVTLKNGIESMLMHYIEEVTGVRQVLDVEEEISLREFEKLENKLKQEKQHATLGHQPSLHSSAPPAL